MPGHCASRLSLTRRYGTAIQEFRRAEAIDSSFLTPTCHSSELAAFCRSVFEAVGGKCKVASSRLLQMQSSIKNFISAAQSHGQHKLLPLVTISQLLQQGEQSSCRLEVMVLRTMQCDSQASITAIVMDVDATVAAVSLLTDPDLLRPGDMLSLPSPPPLRLVKWDASDDAADSFPLLRIEDVTCAAPLISSVLHNYTHYICTH